MNCLNHELIKKEYWIVFIGYKSCTYDIRDILPFKERVEQMTLALVPEQYGIAISHTNQAILDDIYFQLKVKILVPILYEGLTLY